MNFKHLFFTTLFAASFGLVACDDSSSANSSNDNQNNIQQIHLLFLYLLPAVCTCQ